MKLPKAIFVIVQTLLKDLKNVLSPVSIGKSWCDNAGDNNMWQWDALLALATLGGMT
jgi:hypothetical protein